MFVWICSLASPVFWSLGKQASDFQPTDLVRRHEMNMVADCTQRKGKDGEWHCKLGVVPNPCKPVPAATDGWTSNFERSDVDSKYAMMDPRDGDAEDGGALCCRAPCTQWACWKWVFPDRVGDYDDFATSAQVPDQLVQPEKSDPELNRRLLALFSGLSPTAARMVRENRFPVCLCALNLLELLLCHLKLKEPLPLVCPCCGTENAELETSQQPSRSHPELRGFAALMGDASSLASAAFTHQLACADGGPAEVALAHVFAHSLLVLDAVWKQQLQRDPTTTLLHFREALVETRLRVVAFLSRRRTPLTLGELDVWSYHQRARCRSFRTTR
ncbi:hypothetical protein BBJ28_00011358 [Nothophytophthora sp. Chile5]|nr:hypothetical protein BBJ28_00011358 [Nothophytophthora sp. Chile5]